MDRLLKVLIVEDSEDDALLLIRELKKGGYDPEFEVVDTLDGVDRALEKNNWEIVISDYSLPGFNALTVLNLVKEKGMDLPFIIVSGAIVEGTAVAAMKAGAHDYLMKDNLARLTAAIERELREAKGRQEHRQAEEALWKSKNRYSTLVENTLDAIAIIQHDKIKFVNRASQKLFGYLPEEIIEMDVMKLIRPEYREDSMNRYLDRKAGKDVPPTNESACIRKDGTTLPLDISVIPGIDYEGEPAELVVIRDISERKQGEKERERLEARLRQAQKMEAIGTLAGGIAHDFNNILFPIIGYTEMTLQDLPKESKAWKNLTHVLISADRAKDLVQQILTFGRRDEKERKPIQIQYIIKEVLKLLRSSIPTSIEIREEIGGEFDPVSADPTEIHQIVMNLCTNAYHAMREKGGVMEVSLKKVEVCEGDLLLTMTLEPGAYLRLTVSDTGHGIDRLVLERIFDPYYTTKAPGEGTGMGLSITHGIIKSYGGNIQVYSEPGEGTVFHVYLPLIHMETEKPRAVESLLPVPTGTEHILLVDDEEQIALMVQEMLERLGYRVTSRTSSVEALKAFQAQPDIFDLVITDMAMPNMTGTELAPELLKVRPDIPIIICTGFSEIVNEDKAMAMGIREYLMKPIIRNEMAIAIRRVLD